MKKKYKQLVEVLAVAVLACALFYVTGRVQAVKKIKLSQTKLFLNVNEQKKLELKGATGKVKWATNKKKVATVSQKGVVTAVKKGKAVITASNGKKRYKCEVTVTNMDVPSESKIPDNTNLPEVSQEPGQTASSSSDANKTDNDVPVVYMTKSITPEGLMSVYNALGWIPKGKVAVKISTGEPPASNYLKPELIKNLVQSVNGTIVECNTAYGGSRSETAMHYQVAKDHGFMDIADVKILDEDGSMYIPVTGGTHLKENCVGKAFADYNSYLVLSHFKGHAMAGFGGAIKNISIGLGSSEGKCLIHTAGNSSTNPWGGGQDAFLESMGDAGKAVSDYLGNGENITYINVMNRLSIDCDCDGKP